MADNDFELLIKMLGMTSSDNDNIAAVAMRKANALALRLGGWEAILRGKVKVTVMADPFANIPMPRAQQPVNAPRGSAAPPRHTPQYSPPPSPPPSQPKAPDLDAMWGAAGGGATQAPNAPPPIPNKYPGTCTTCRQMVGVGDGIAYMSGSQWKTRHHPGRCPAAKPRARSAFTTDDLQV